MTCQTCNKDLSKYEDKLCFKCQEILAELQRYHSHLACDLDKAKAQLRENLSFTDALDTLRKLKTAAKEKGFPKMYQADLTEHDAISIAMFAAKHGPRQQFIWLLREMGTHLYHYNTKHVHETIAYHRRNKTNLHYYYYNGEILMELDNHAQVQSALASLPERRGR